MCTLNSFLRQFCCRQPTDHAQKQCFQTLSNDTGWTVRPTEVPQNFIPTLGELKSKGLPLANCKKKKKAEVIK